MNIAKLGALLVAGTLVLAAPAVASPVTDAVTANLIPNVDFLDKSSRLAIDASQNAKVRDFARAQAAEQTAAANSLDEWGRAQAAARAMLASVSPEDEVVQTGRSVAIEGASFDTRVSLGPTDLEALNGLSGPAFDAAYKARQLDALTQIARDYETYIVRGDDPILLGIANSELPKVRHRIGELRKL